MSPARDIDRMNVPLPEGHMIDMPLIHCYAHGILCATRCLISTFMVTLKNCQNGRPAKVELEHGIAESIVRFMLCDYAALSLNSINGALLPFSTKAAQNPHLICPIFAVTYM